VLGGGQHVERRGDVAGELLAVDGQGDRPVWAGAQQRGAGGGFELADLTSEDGVPDAELAGGVAESGLAGEGEEPADGLPGARAGEGVPDGQRECAGATVANQVASLACGIIGSMTQLTDVSSAFGYGDSILAGERVRLRGVRDDDLPVLATWEMDAGRMATLSNYRHRESVWHDGRWYDEVLMSILDHEWAARRPPGR
jgi:hypothetical protein